MNLFCIDIGNTSTSCCKVQNNVIGDLYSIIDDDEQIEHILQYNFSNIDAVIISSVVPMKSKIIEDNLKSRDIDYFNISYNNISWISNSKSCMIQ